MWPPPEGAVGNLNALECIMVPGLGSRRPDGQGWTDTDTEYWGDLHNVCVPMLSLHEVNLTVVSRWRAAHCGLGLAGCHSSAVDI